MLLLIDAANLIHRSYHAMPDLRTRDGRPTGATKGFCMKLCALLTQYQPSHVVAAMDTPAPLTEEEEALGLGGYRRSWRALDYKAGRSKADKSDLYAQIDDCRRVTEVLGCHWVNSAGWEADDVIAHLTADYLQSDQNPQERVIIHSNDTDLWSLFHLPRVFFDVSTRERLVNRLDAAEILGFPPHRLLLFTALCGGHNGLGGVQGVGRKTAQFLASTFTGEDDFLDAVDRWSKGGIYNAPMLAQAFKRVTTSPDWRERFLETAFIAKFERVDGLFSAHAYIRHAAPLEPRRALWNELEFASLPPDADSVIRQLPLI